MPVLAIGGERSYGPAVGGAMESLAADVQSVVIPARAIGWPRKLPRRFLAALNAFLAPGRGGDNGQFSELVREAVASS